MLLLHRARCVFEKDLWRAQRGGYVLVRLRSHCDGSTDTIRGDPDSEIRGVHARSPSGCVHCDLYCSRGGDRGQNCRSSLGIFKSRRRADPGSRFRGSQTSSQTSRVRGCDSGSEEGGPRGFGGQLGRGAVSCKKNAGNGPFGPPAMISITGGSFGFQIGGQESDIVMLFMTPDSLKHLLRDKVTLGVDASAAAGPKGREASADTTATMRS